MPRRRWQPAESTAQAAGRCSPPGLRPRRCRAVLLPGPTLRCGLGQAEDRHVHVDRLQIGDRHLVGLVPHAHGSAALHLLEVVAPRRQVGCVGVGGEALQMLGAPPVREQQRGAAEPLLAAQHARRGMGGQVAQAAGHRSGDPGYGRHTPPLVGGLGHGTVGAHRRGPEVNGRCQRRSTGLLHLVPGARGGQPAAVGPRAAPDGLGHAVGGSARRDRTGLVLNRRRPSGAGRREPIGYRADQVD